MKKKKSKKEDKDCPYRQRMYHFVLYQLSPIQQGIQAYHAGIEYSRLYGRKKNCERWMDEDKTVIILNGGTARDMFRRQELFQNKGIRNMVFNEPDLEGIGTAIALLVDERVWDKEKYPDDEYEFIGEDSEEIIFLRGYLQQFKLA